MDPYNKAVIPRGKGLINIGQRCWFNTLMQTLLSSSHFIETIKANVKEDVISLIAAFIESYSREDIMMIPEANSIHDKLIVADGELPQSGIRVGVANCLFEALTGLISITKNKFVEDLFTIIYSRKIVCNNCKHATEPKTETNFTVTLPAAVLFEYSDATRMIHLTAAEKHEKFVSWLRWNQTEVRDYKCENCGLAGHCALQSMLKRIRQIIIFQMAKNQYWFPKEFGIPRPTGADGSKSELKYRLTAVTHHTGAHWYVDCLRRGHDGELKFVRADDASITPTNPASLTISPGMLMYCCSGINTESIPDDSLFATDTESIAYINAGTNKHALTPARPPVTTYPNWPQVRGMGLESDRFGDYDFSRMFN